ncbi:MAG: ATP-binding protein [Pseudonocardiaceae bacterium]
MTIERVLYATVRVTDDQLRVRFERGVRWVVEQYRSEAVRALVHKARLVAARLLTPPGTTSLSMASRGSAVRYDPEVGTPDVLAGMCGGIALRDLTLVDSLLAQLEGMEATEGDPDALARLYQLDHLAARLRRNAENLRVLAGHDPGSAASVASPLVDVIRAALSSIEQYRRIDIGRVVPLAVADFAADDVGRLLAELLDNATSYSPPTSSVTVGARLGEGGDVLVRIEDSGTGLPADRLEAVNALLAAPARLDSWSIEHLGLAVVRRLAGNHGIRVSLENRPVQGAAATVLLPAHVMCETPATSWFVDTPAMLVPSPRPAPTSARAAAGLPPSPRVPLEDAGRGRVPPAQRTTRNGLPRRIPQSMREFAVEFVVAGSAAPGESNDPDVDPSEGREKLMTDLGDFSDGEQAARRDAGSHE